MSSSGKPQRGHSNKQIPPKKNAYKKAQRKAIRRNIIIFSAVVILFLIFIIVSNISSGPNSGSSTVGVGSLAPNGTLTETSGSNLQISSLKGSPSLIWFVSTWCSSCQQGTQVMNGYISKFKALKVKVIEAELYDDLGQSGPSIASFGSQLAGNNFNSPNWIFATASQKVIQTYDPKSYLDIYYLMNSKGKITYINGSPGSTMSSLLAQAELLT